MDSFFIRLESKVNLAVVLLFLALMLVMLNIINGKSVGVAKLKQITNGTGILDFERGYSVEKAYKILDGQGAEGRVYYLKRILPMDFIFPLTYMLFYLTTILFLLKLLHPANGLVHYLAIFPILQAVFDYLENLAIIRMLVCYPQKQIITTKLASSLTILKFAFMYMSLGLMAVLLCLNLFSWVRPKLI